MKLITRMGKKIPLLLFFIISCAFSLSVSAARGGNGGGSGGGDTTLSSLSCSSGQVAEFNGTDWVCADQSLSGSDTLSSLSCSDGEVAKYDSGAWGCAADNDFSAGTVVIDSTMVDLIDQAIYFNGSGLLGISIELAGTSLTPDASSTDALLKLNFNATLAGIITAPGIFFFDAGDQRVPVNFISAVNDPSIPATCPCQPEWDNYGIDTPSPDGFSDVPPLCKNHTADQLTIYFYDTNTTGIWVTNTAFKAIGQECSLVGDAPARVLSSFQEHEACETYLETHHGPIASIPDC